MKYLIRYFEHLEDSRNHKSIYEIDWHRIAPDFLVVIKGDTTDMNGFIKIIDDEGKVKITDQLCKYKIGNIMHDLVTQMTYDNDFDLPGLPDTLEMDVSIIKNESDGKFHLDIEITFGDLIVAGFTIESPNKISVYQYTSYHSKNDPSNSVFALDEESLQKLMKFLNHFDGIQIERKDLNFLDNNPHNYYPS